MPAEYFLVVGSCVFDNPNDHVFGLTVETAKGRLRLFHDVDCAPIKKAGRLFARLPQCPWSSQSDMTTISRPADLPGLVTLQ